MAQHVAADITPAPPLRLYGPDLPRSDANSPVLREPDRTLAFMSYYEPIGHSYRRLGGASGFDWGPAQRVLLVDDPDPVVGKWIESVVRLGEGQLLGWYHGETVAPCLGRSFTQHIGALVSDDEGASWHVLDDLLRPNPDQIDCNYRNGAMVGGFGDFCVVLDRDDGHLYVHFSSYIADERAQGIAVARYPLTQWRQPRQHLEWWTAGGWRGASVGDLPQPIWGVRRGWRYADPDAFWGPAVHYNHALGGYVMLLNRTKDGDGDYRSDGIYLSFNRRLDDPQGWSEPVEIVRSGGWYPQVIGERPGEGDTELQADGRLFISGYSAWNIAFRFGAPAAPFFIERSPPR